MNTSNYIDTEYLIIGKASVGYMVSHGHMVTSPNPFVRVARSPVFYGRSHISAYNFTICPMPFCIESIIFFESPVFSMPKSGNPILRPASEVTGFLLYVITESVKYLGFHKGGSFFLWSLMLF